MLHAWVGLLYYQSFCKKAFIILRRKAEKRLDLELFRLYNKSVNELICYCYPIRKG